MSTMVTDVSVASRLADHRMSVYLANMDDTNWLKHVRCVLEVSMYIANTLSAGSNAIVHCRLAMHPCDHHTHIHMQ